MENLNSGVLCDVTNCKHNCSGINCSLDKVKITCDCTDCTCCNSFKIREED